MQTNAIMRMISISLFFSSILTAIFLVACSAKNAPTVPENNVRFLRKSGPELIQITDKTKLEMNDYVVFTKDPNKSISVDELEKNSESHYSIESFSECRILDKTYTLTNHFSQNTIQLKSVLPLEFFLSGNSESVCDFKITLQNGDATKTFKFSQALIKNNNSVPMVLLGDEKARPLNQSLDSVSENEFDHYTIVNAEQNDEVSLICENFRTIPEKIDLEILNLRKIARFTHIYSYSPNAIDPRGYIPYQTCVIYLKKKDGRAVLSQSFQMRYAPVEPSVKFIDNSTIKQNPRSWNAFFVNISNPKSHPITIALDKSKLSLMIEIKRQACGKQDTCSLLDGGKPIVPLTPIFSSPEGLVEKENMFLIHLKPAQTLHITFNMTINRNDTYWIKYDTNSKRNLIENLRVNYQSLDDLTALPEFIGQVQSN